jgi:expansin (peptidoglycan-binding protein)
VYVLRRGWWMILPLLGCGDAASRGNPDAGSLEPGEGPSEDPGSGEPGACDFRQEEHHGDGTYYAADGSGNCSLPATPSDLMVAAMNATDYAGSAACGACAQITGPNGAVRVRIVDQCPECAAGAVDLSPQAFEKIAPIERGRVPIRWHYEACDVSGGVIYHFKDGSNAWWLAVQVRNHRLPIEKLEYRADDGAFHPLSRVDYNYFVAEGGIGPGPFTFRVTDVEGQQIESPGIPLRADQDAPATQQFPGCR